MSYFKSLLLFMVLACISCKADNRVAILGESYILEPTSSGINEDVLAQLFTIIREKNPAAVIFTGNMTLGLKTISTAPEPITNPKPIYPLVPPEVNVEEEVWPQKNFVYDSDTFKKQILAFIGLKTDNLGNEIPFYPIINSHETFGQDSVDIFLEAFKIKNEATTNASALAYTFSIGNAFFILFSEVSFDPAAKKPEKHSINQALLNWLWGVLKAVRSKYDFAFVVGTQPAFSTTAANGVFKGLDVDIVNRNRFWQLLSEFQVTAYFCSGERLYDRTNRHGIWQIISGGAGAPLYKRAFDKAFYHYLLLSIPESKEKFPKIQVFDPHGTIVDEFELAPTRYPVYQLRISTS